jgi:hypothetical protein
MTKPIARDSMYRQCAFDAEVIPLCVRWYHHVSAVVPRPRGDDGGARHQGRPFDDPAMGHSLRTRVREAMGSVLQDGRHFVARRRDVRLDQGQVALRAGKHGRTRCNRVKSHKLTRADPRARSRKSRGCQTIAFRVTFSHGDCVAETRQPWLYFRRPTLSTTADRSGVKCPKNTECRKATHIAESARPHHCQALARLRARATQLMQPPIRPASRYRRYAVEARPQSERRFHSRSFEPS